MKRFATSLRITKSLSAAILIAFFTSTWATAQTAGFYVAENGQANGPFDTQQITQMATTGRISGQTLVWAEGMPNWAPAASVAQLAQVFQTSVPPQPKFEEYLEGAWTTDFTQVPIDGMGLGEQNGRWEFTKLGTFTFTVYTTLNTNYGVIRQTSKGQGTYKLSNRKADSFSITLNGQRTSSVDGQPGSEPGTVEGTYNIKVLDARTMTDGTTTYRK